VVMSGRLVVAKKDGQGGTPSTPNIPAPDGMGGRPQSTATHDFQRFSQLKAQRGVCVCGSGTWTGGSWWLFVVV
jgi:hypothetical protein